jgi:hypothetical protein
MSWAVILFLLASGCSRPPSDAALFRESVTAGKAANEDVRWYIFTEIAEAQMERAYYTDALGTIALVDKYPDQLYVRIATVRANSGDVVGAKSMAAAWDPDLKLRAYKEIALVQAGAGDIRGALETSRDIPDKSIVLDAIASRQLESGDLEGALATAAAMKREWKDETLFAVAQKFRERGDERRAHAIERRISNLNAARSGGFVQDAGGASTTQAPRPTDACLSAWDDAKAGNYAEANEKVRVGHCDCRTVAGIHVEEHDPDGADRAIRACPSTADMSAGMAGLATRYASRGEIAEALRFADSVRVAGDPWEEGYLAPTLRDIGLAWGKKGNPRSALRWARSRPNGFERAMALLGVAESISPAKNSSPK